MPDRHTSDEPGVTRRPLKRLLEAYAEHVDSPDGDLLRRLERALDERADAPVRTPDRTEDSRAAR
jgi:hypothetical protein